MPRRKQENLLREPWNALIILDACRADLYERLHPQAETVQTMTYGGRAATGEWIARFMQVFNRPALYVEANPTCALMLEPQSPQPGARDLSKLDHRYTVLSLWRTLWGRYCPKGYPTTHPRAVYEGVMGYLQQYGQPERMVIHMAQPHLPYIGEVRLPHFGGLRHPARIWRLVLDGDVSVEDCSAAYVSNLELVSTWAHRLIELLSGIVIVTADHGELLGDRWKGRRFFGHINVPLLPGLIRVPWDMHQRGEFDPAPLPDLHGAVDPDFAEKLRALGYL